MELETNLGNKVKSVAIFVVLIVAGVALLVTAKSPGASEGRKNYGVAESVPLHYFWSGWNGPHTMYPTYRGRVDLPTYLSSFHYKSERNSSEEGQLSADPVSYNLLNAVATNLTQTSSHPSVYGYIGGNEWQANLFYSASSSTKQFIDNSGDAFGVFFVVLSANVTGADTNHVNINLETSYDNGLNVSAASVYSLPYDLKNSVTKESAQGAFLDFQAYTGLEFGTWKYIASFAGETGYFPTFSNLKGYVGNGGTYAAVEVVNGTGLVTNSVWPSEGNNSMVADTEAQVTVDPANFTNPSAPLYENLTLGGRNFAATEYHNSLGQLVYYSESPGAVADLTLYIRPAVSIGGYVYLGPKSAPAANMEMTLQQTNKSGSVTDFVVRTNANGLWQFFAHPGYYYSLDASYSNSLGSVSKVENLSSLTTLSQIGQNNTAGPIYLGAGLVTGNVLDVSGNPLPGATVHVMEGQFSETVGSNSSGQYSFIAPVANTFMLWATYSGYTTPSKTVTSTANTTVTAPPLQLEYSSTITGYVQTSGGSPIDGATVQAWNEITHNSFWSSTNLQGYYSVNVGDLGNYSVGASAAGYNSNNVNVDIIGYNITIQAATIKLSSQNTGGNGCVLFDSNISLYNDSTILVQNLKTGEITMSYYPQLGVLYPSIVSEIVVSNVTSVFNIDEGLICVSGPTDQPLYAQYQNGTDAWVLLGNLTVGMKLLDPLSGSWINITSLVVMNGNFTVYEVDTIPFFLQQGALRNDYIANGILLDHKIG